MSNGKFFVWDAYDATHDKIAKTDDTDIAVSLVFFETMHKLENDCDWYMGKVFEGQGYVFIADSHIDQEHLDRYRCTVGSKYVASFSGDQTDSGRKLWFPGDIIP